MKTIENPTIRIFHPPSFGRGDLAGPGTIPARGSVQVSDEYYDKLRAHKRWAKRLEGNRIKHPVGPTGLLEQRIISRREGRARNVRAESAEARAQAMEAQVAELQAQVAQLVKASKDSSGKGGKG